MNAVGAEATEQHRRQFELLVRQAGAMWEVRKPPTGGYNCVGHVFACRRTEVIEGEGGLSPETHLLEILNRDGYRRFEHGAGETACVGDVVVYWDAESAIRHLLHVGVIHEMRPMYNVDVRVVMPHVLSKWDGGSGECLHHFRHVPQAWGKYDVEFWTDRPPVTGERP